MNPLRKIYRRIRYSITVLGILHIMAMKSPHDKIGRTFYRMRGTKIGKNVYIDKDVYIEGFRPDLITIEDNVEIGPRTVIVAIDSSYNCVSNRKVPNKFRRVTIRRNAYIGANATILPGVTIGENSIVGAAAVVTRDVPPRTVVTGIPARPIKKIDEKLSKIRKGSG